MRWLGLGLGVLLSALPLGVVGCAEQGDVSIDGEVNGYSFDGGAGLAELTGDGQLFGIMLNDKVAPGCNQHPEGESLNLTIYTHDLEPGTYEVGGESREVNPYLQVSGAMIDDMVVSGFLTLETATPDRYAGFFEFTWPGDQTLSGTFDVPTCVRP